MKTIVISIGVIFILVFIGLSCSFITMSDEAGECKSTYEWVDEFVTKNNYYVGGYISTELKFVSSSNNGNKTEEYWEYIYYFSNSYEVWETRILFDSKYSNDSVPRKAIYHLRSDATPRKYLPES